MALPGTIITGTASLYREFDTVMLRINGSNGAVLSVEGRMRDFLQTSGQGKTGITHGAAYGTVILTPEVHGQLTPGNGLDPWTGTSLDEVSVDGALSVLMAALHGGYTASVPPPPTAYRYWRVAFSYSNGPSQIHVRHLDLRGEDVDVPMIPAQDGLTEGGSFASSADAGKDSWRAFQAPPAAGTDGWQTDKGDHMNSFLGYDFGAAAVVRQVRITCPQDSDMSPWDISIEATNDDTLVSWVQLHYADSLDIATTWAPAAGSPLVFNF